MAKATRFPVATTAEAFPVLVLGIDDTVRERDKLAPDGSKTYASGCLLKVERADGSVATDKSASIHVLKPCAEGRYDGLYIARGRVWVQPWTSDGGRLAYSITVDELVPWKRQGQA